MTEIRFYHLQRANHEQVVPDLLKKAVERDFKILFKLPNAAHCRYYDDLLWRYQPERFLPHACEGDAESELHPIWITTKDQAPNKPNMALLAENVELPPLAGLSLVCHVFDGNSDLDRARQLWSSLKKDKDLTLTYWKQQDTGAWQKQDL